MIKLHDTNIENEIKKDNEEKAKNQYLNLKKKKWKKFRQ